MSRAEADSDKLVADDGTEADIDDVAGNEDKGKRKYTYDKELELRGITRQSDAYREAIPLAMHWLRVNRQFYGYILDEMTVTTTQTTKTAHVTVGALGIDMAMNPDFMALLPMRHRAGVIMHECIHVMSLHLTRIRESFSRYGLGALFTANIAADLAMNSLLADPRDLPKFGVKPEQFRIPDDKLPPDKWHQFPARSTFETYMRLLNEWDKDKLKAMLARAGIGVEHGPQPDGGDDGQVIVVIDDHGVWTSDEGSILDQDILNEVIRTRVRRANNRAISAGTVPGEIKEIIDELLRDKTVDFAQLFAGLIGRYRSSVRMPSMLRPNRRYPCPPGRKQGYRLRIRIYIDTSGSMESEQIMVLLSEAVNAEDTGLAEVVVQQFDASLQGDPVSVRDMGRINVGIKGRGGTVVAPVMADIDKHQPDLAIIGTDGGLERNVRPATNTPVVWMLTPDGEYPGWGECVRLPSIAEIKSGRYARIGELAKARTHQ